MEESMFERKLSIVTAATSPSMERKLSTAHDNRGSSTIKTAIPSLPWPRDLYSRWEGVNEYHQRGTTRQDAGIYEGLEQKKSLLPS